MPSVSRITFSASMRRSRPPFRLCRHFGHGLFKRPCRSIMRKLPMRRKVSESRRVNSRISSIAEARRLRPPELLPNIAH
jgi:hypothetical protein